MRSELNALWARLRALQRRFARELAEYRLEPLCDDLCHRWYVAWSDHKPLPEIQPFIRRVIDAGYGLLHWARPENTCTIVFAKVTPQTPKCCSTPSSPRPGPLADGKPADCN